MSTSKDSPLTTLREMFPTFSDEALRICVESPLFQLVEGGVITTNGNPRPRCLEPIKVEG